MRPFDGNPTRETRALQCYLILIGYALRRQTVTYGELARLLGFGGSGVMGAMLGPIMYYCEKEGLPALTSIVVNEATGRPGGGFHSRNKQLHELHHDVFNFDWYGYYPPTVEELREAVTDEDTAA